MTDSADKKIVENGNACPPIAPPSFIEYVGKDCWHGRNARSRYNKKVAVWMKTAGYCTYCSSPLDFVMDFEMDHVVPKSAGGSHAVVNLAPACTGCNRKKSNRDAAEFSAQVRAA